MPLFEKLVGSEDPKLAVHQFVAGLHDWEDGVSTRAEIISAFGLSVADEVDLDWLKSKYLASSDKKHFIIVLEGCLCLGEQNLLGYDIKTNFIARITGLP